MLLINDMYVSFNCDFKQAYIELQFSNVLFASEFIRYSDTFYNKLYNVLIFFNISSLLSACCINLFIKIICLAIFLKVYFYIDILLANNWQS